MEIRTSTEIYNEGFESNKKWVCLEDIKEFFVYHYNDLKNDCNIYEDIEHQIGEDFLD